MTKRRRNNELIKRQHHAEKNKELKQNAIIHEVWGNDKKYQWTSKKDKRMPKQKRQEHAKMKEKNYKKLQ